MTQDAAGLFALRCRAEPAGRLTGKRTQDMGGLLAPPAFRRRGDGVGAEGAGR
jgi:hypothetical protein